MLNHPKAKLLQTKEEKKNPAIQEDFWTNSLRRIYKEHWGCRREKWPYFRLQMDTCNVV